MVLTVIPGILQSLEMISSNQNLRLDPSEPPHLNALPPLTLRNPCPPLHQSPSPYPILARLSLNRPLSLNSLTITLLERSVPSPSPITHPHLSPQP